jgi:hypothetical protein
MVAFVDEHLAQGRPFEAGAGDGPRVCDPGRGWPHAWAGYEKSAAVAPLSSAVRAKTTLPQAKRHQCCMCSEAPFAVARTVKAQRRATIASVSLAATPSVRTR